MRNARHQQEQDHEMRHEGVMLVASAHSEWNDPNRNISFCYPPPRLTQFDEKGVEIRT